MIRQGEVWQSKDVTRPRTFQVDAEFSGVFVGWYIGSGEALYIWLSADALDQWVLVAKLSRNTGD